MRELETFAHLRAYTVHDRCKPFSFTIALLAHEVAKVIVAPSTGILFRLVGIAPFILSCTIPNVVDLKFFSSATSNSPILTNLVHYHGCAQIVSVDERAHPYQAPPQPHAIKASVLPDTESSSLLPFDTAPDTKARAFFMNFGPDTTTSVISGELFPTRYRSTRHGLFGAIASQSSAMGA